MTQEEQKEIILLKLNRAMAAINEAEFLSEHKYWNTAVNKMYYSCSYAVGALLVSIGVFTKTHAGTQQMFSLHFIKTGILPKEAIKFYTNLFDMRQEGDYEDAVDYEANDVLPLIQPTRAFIMEIQKLLFPQ